MEHPGELNETRQSEFGEAECIIDTRSLNV